MVYVTCHEGSEDQYRLLTVQWSRPLIHYGFVKEAGEFGLKMWMFLNTMPTLWELPTQAYDWAIGYL